MQITNNKEYITRSGKPVRIYDIISSQERAVHGAIYDKGEWKLASWELDGGFNSTQQSHKDLIEAPKPFSFTKWVNIYKNETSDLHDTRDYADKICDEEQRIACIEITISGVEGEGL